VTILTGFFDLPAMPGTNVPIIQVKGGDICVHLAGTFAYIVALGRGMNPWFTSLMYPLNLGLNVQGRAGMVAFAVAVAVAMTLRPFHPRMMRIFFVTAVGLFFFWASEIKIEKGPRELSFDFLEKALMSIVKESDDTAMEGSKEWRMNWWKDIVNYTFHGKYFWMGKGFGINLANDDGYQVDSEDALRSPHNGHMTMLARTGVPGLGIWAAVQLTWGVIIVKSYIRARRDKRMNWSGVFMFLGSYWAAFLANATFDVFLEGPMGGIWFWCIYGAGIGCAYLYKRYPDLLTPPEVEPVGASPVTTPPRR
jgi:O-antigen ligase